MAANAAEIKAWTRTPYASYFSSTLSTLTVMPGRPTAPMLFGFFCFFHLLGSGFDCTACRALQNTGSARSLF